MNIKIFYLTFILFANHTLEAQKIELADSGTNTSIRGISVVNDKIIWASGSNGYVGLSLDGGKKWSWMIVKGHEQTDFRDIEAFDAVTAVIMGVGSPAYILKTFDAGASWKIVFEDDRPGMFLDAMEFWNEISGIVLGDPIDGKIFIARTFNAGNNWRGLPDQYYPVADSGEAMFAASGTNIRASGKDEAVFVTGGLRSRIFVRDKKIDLPILQGNGSSGANSIAVKNSKYMIVTGGDYTRPADTDKNCFISRDGGIHWFAPVTAPHGYRSCVEFLGKKKWISCGLNGVDISDDDGLNWTLISSEGFHVVRKAKKGNAVFLAGTGGRIAKLVQ